MKPSESSEKPLAIFDLSQREAFEAPVDQYYHRVPFHRARDVGFYRVDAMVRDHASTLMRSSQEFMNSSSGLTRKLFWVNLLFDRGEGVFWHALQKGGYGESNNTFTICVTAPSPERAAQELTYLQQEYGKEVSAKEPAFYLLRGGKQGPVEVKVGSQHAMGKDDLELHYGDSFGDWAARFLEVLAEPGLSILQGKPGTGKTSFLRYVITQLWETHRFYYIPVENAGILHSSSLPEFWSKEHRSHPDASMVFVVEDAENILLDRKKGNEGVASILNLTDGFIGDLVKLHIICTINTEVEALDTAILRPGRQKAFREFSLLDYPRAKALAERLGIKLAEQRDYTLAELYHFKDVQSQGLKSGPVTRQVGFGQKS